MDLLMVWLVGTLVACYLGVILLAMVGQALSGIGSALCLIGQVLCEIRDRLPAPNRPDEDDRCDLRP
jgi:hypothetical protein